MQMPVINGYEASQQIKSQSQGKSTPIIAISANAFLEDQQNALSDGCDDFISKPFQANKLLEIVAKHLHADYIYAAENKVTQFNFNEAEMKLYLSQTSSQWREKIYSASCLGDDNQIFELLKELPSSQNQLQASITGLANDFRFDKIIELIEDEFN